jgi:stage V sporulation protein AD
VLAAEILPALERGEYNRVLFAATGALLSPLSSLQGESIPSISHAAVIERIG